MKTLTKKQRREIYLKVIERGIVKAIWGFTLCHSIHQAAGESFDFGKIEELFTEFELFKPEKMEGETSRWWNNDDEDVRIICMLLCAEMCND